MQWLRLLVGLSVLAVGPVAVRVEASEAQRCVVCHRYADAEEADGADRVVRRYHVSETDRDATASPHSRLSCTDCHDEEEVGVVPHSAVSFVDCSRTCHLTEADGSMTITSHQPAKQMLRASVHSQGVLDASNALLGRPLRAGQSRCLLCHDEGTIRRAGDEPGRSNRDAARLCATCHHNSAIRNEYELPDAIASYLSSFHGKAMLLGNWRTAGCLDCHARHGRDVHLILSDGNRLSSTHPGNLAGTCRSPQCHPSAGERISSAAVHLDLSTSLGVEFLVAVLFVVLIVTTFGPSIVLTALEMFHIVVGRESVDHRRHRRLAERLAADPVGRVRLKRFTVHQRVQHWLLAVCFVVLVITGFPMKFADRAWSAWVIEHLGGLDRARLIHHGAGLVLILGFLYHVLYLRWIIRRRQRATGQEWLDIALDQPMVMNRADWRHLRELLGYLLFLRPTRPKGGRFSVEEKFEYFGVFWGVTLLGLTGLVMWGNAVVTQHLPGRVLTIASLIHSFEAFLALLHVGVVHMVTVIFSPSVFPISRAMFTGDTPVEELAEGHAGMLETVAREIEADTADEDCDKREACEST